MTIVPTRFCLHALLIFFCTHSYSSESEIVLRPEGSSRKGLKLSCPNGQSVSEAHFEDEFSRLISAAESRDIETPELYIHKRELKEPPSQMEIGLFLDDYGLEFIIPADDPLRKDISLFVHLNAFVASVYGDKKAKQRLHELAFQGAPLSSCYSMCSVWFIQIGPGLEPGFVLIEKRLKTKKGILSNLTLNTDSEKDALCAVAQGRDARYTALKTALTTGDLPDTLITLIKSFDENSPEELAKIQKIREKIQQERKNKTTLFKLAANFLRWITSRK